MKLRISLAALLASSLVVAPAIAEVETEKANVRGGKLEQMKDVPDDLKEKRNEMNAAIELIRKLQD
eukprot:CAMPEP_0197461872 /NCGR_PEP_ID=MMETSP1175-20131217/57613_1 /TAXON_ID=1003142 /ORGANISM="Triceratium dubium, Strain CCMP147" /LENGTH=65 /DNA_ID=CAMNT_0042997243 /DNA_START=130 /DNA_END=324 /DNA_ORIENTATION=+